MKKRLIPLRTLPVNWLEISQQSGIKCGRLCHHKVLGWGVQNANRNGPDFGCITPPKMQGEETHLRIHRNKWQFYKLAQ